ncbi:unnamed protein product [Cuscuta campestris]|uniref:Uncharacterized protein n=1 Tax=Cuscuta campestris TaxID=132261 RepID=A0A484LFC2_9ASTE|nr:unnamed protein product [Cuscuta campestris]
MSVKAYAVRQPQGSSGVRCNKLQIYVVRFREKTYALRSENFLQSVHLILFRSSLLQHRRGGCCPLRPECTARFFWI